MTTGKLMKNPNCKLKIANFRFSFFLPGVPPPLASQATAGRPAAARKGRDLSAEARRTSEGGRWVVPDNFKEQSWQLNTLQTVVLPDSLHAAFPRACCAFLFATLLQSRETKIYGQASRLISNGKLNVSRRLHTRPITWSSSRSL